MILQIIANGIVLSLVYALVALGLTMVYGVMRILNWAHGEIVMLGAYIGWLFVVVLELNFFLALVVSMLSMAALGAGIERVMFRPMRGKAHLTPFIMSMGLVFILQVVAIAVFGVTDKAIPTVFPGTLIFAGTVIPFERLALIPIAGGLTVGYYIFLQRTKQGRAIRAAAQDETGALLQGISINRCGLIAMSTGCALAGAAGCLIAPIFTVNPFMGTKLVWKAFVIVFVGGMGSVVGTILGAFLIGFTGSIVGTLIDPKWVTMIEMLILLLILLFRPGGIMNVEI
jgi:branched-chain amino acid transport system permease protein